MRMNVKLFRFFFVILVFFAVYIIPINVAAGSNDDEALLNAHMGLLDFGGIDSVIDNSGGVLRGESIGDLALRAVRGQLNLSPGALLDTIFSLFFAEVRTLLVLMRNLILIAVLSAFFTAFTASFKSAGVAQMGFYVNYLAIIAVLLTSFVVCIGIMQGMAEQISELMLAVVPLTASIAVMSGSVTAGYVFSPAVIFFAGFTVNVMRFAIIPLITAAAVMQVLSYATKKEMLEKLSELIKSIISWGLKITAGMFITILALQRFSAPLMNSAVVRSSRFMLNLVPVVGGSLSGAVDAVMYWSSAVRGGVLTAIIIVIILMCAIPVLQLAAFTLVYKLTAGLIQPVCDERIVKAIDAAGSFAGLMLSVCALLGATFVFAVMIVLSL